MEDLWYQIEGCWTRRLNRRASLAEVLKRAKIGSGGALRSRAVPSPCTLAIASSLMGIIEGLSLSWDAASMILTGNGILFGIDLDQNESNLEEIPYRNPPESVIVTP